ncbi:MAG: hypothetical protein IT374_26700 [Polyangiaceae bacterium]|nr:hypothetical protein [Polyangiaceae bacterium]
MASLAKLPRRMGALAVACLVAGAACSSATVLDDPCPGDASHTIGEACDAVLPAFCRHAVQRCGVGGTVDECVAASRALCCQGGCARVTCTPAPGVLDACVQAYSGEVGDAGVPDGGQGFPCSSVTEGFSPAECRSIVQLKGAPALDLSLRAR